MKKRVLLLGVVGIFASTIAFAADRIITLTCETTGTLGPRSDKIQINLDKGTVNDGGDTLNKVVITDKSVCGYSPRGDGSLKICIDRDTGAYESGYVRGKCAVVNKLF